MGDLNKFCERMDYYCRVASVGYDQWQRWDIWDGGETDCSALVIGCLNEAGFDTGNASYTGNMSGELCARGWTRLAPDLSTCRPGDILLNDGSHTAAVIDGYGWDATVAQASIDENGNISGGQAGDQTGYETNERGMYDYPWDCILRYEGPVDDGKRGVHIHTPNQTDAQRWVFEATGKNSEYFVRNVVSGKYLTLNKTIDRGNGYAVCAGDEKCAWKLTQLRTSAPLDKPVYLTHDAYYLDVVDGKLSSGAGVQARTLSGSKHGQKWYLVWAGQDSTYFLHNCRSDMCLDVDRGGKL